jgi:hypothetical protein
MNGVIAVLGFGQAGSLIARDLVAVVGAAHGIPVTDIAMMAPVPGRGLRVPMLASGDAGYAAFTLRGYGAELEVLDGPAGLADWLRPHIAEELAAADASTVARIVTDASRALHERLARRGTAEA